VQVGFLPWQVLTYGFLHGGLTHLFFNMFALWMFGPALEGTWGSKRFMQYYLVCVIGAGLVQLVVATMAVNSGSPPYPTVGASGGIFGVLLAFGMLFPNHRLMLIFPPIPMRARTFVIVYGVLELVMGVTRTQSGVAHFAHLGGMAFGFLMIQYWRGRWPFRRRPRQG
jgi:membrane associated rhomboid family serine protease